MMKRRDKTRYRQVAKHGGFKAASVETGIPKSTLEDAVRRYMRDTGAAHPFNDKNEKERLRLDEEAYLLGKKHGSWKRAEEATGIDDSTLKSRSDCHRKRHGLDSPMPLGEDQLSESIGKDAPADGIPDENVLRTSLDYREAEDKPLPPEGKVKRYLLTCAQNHTPLAEEFWSNLLVLKAHYGAELMVSRFTYAKSQFQKKREKPGIDPSEGEAVETYPKEIQPYLSDSMVRLAPGIVWCGEFNILPTAVRPLSGLQTYTKSESMVVPHVKVAMESYIRRQGLETPCFGYTTGAVTVRNYLQRKAGQKAEFHHVFGALLVEVDSKGRWWARQINAEHDGTIHDLDLKIADGELYDRQPVASITWGDIHVAQINEDSETAAWGTKRERKGFAGDPASMVKVLRPRHQVFHDVLDFRARNHHDANDPHKMFENFIRKYDNVAMEVAETARWIEDKKKQANRWGGEVAVVASNHDDFFTKWLKRTEAYRTDPVNAIFFLKSQLAYYESIEREAKGTGRRIEPFEWAYSEYCDEKVVFVGEEDSYMVADVEHAMHGHLGPNGSRGSLANLSRLGNKINIGHSHSAGILDGAYQAGVTGKLHMTYNRGPSSWSHSHIVTYENGKRAIITEVGGKWRA